MRGFPVKTGTGSGNTHGTSLFAISNCVFELQNLKEKKELWIQIQNKRKVRIQKQMKIEEFNAICLLLFARVLFDLLI